jgi:hypothetical protein
MTWFSRAVFLITTLSLTGAGLPVSSAQAARTVELKNMIARVVIEPAARNDVELKVDYGTNNALPKIMVKTSGDRLIADGQINLRAEAGLEGDLAVRVNGGSRVDVADLPVVHVFVPMDTRISASRGIYVGEIGKATSLYLALNGQGRWTLAEVEGHADIALGGAETVRSGPVDSANVSLSGASEFELQSAASLRMAAEGAATATVNSLSGPAQFNLSGTSNVSVIEGVTPSLNIINAGSGLLRFDAVADEASVSVTGAGQVSLRKVTGALRKSIEGAGVINVGH